MKERCWVSVYMPLIRATAFVYFGDEGFRQYDKWRAGKTSVSRDMIGNGGLTFKDRSWVSDEMDLDTLVHELNHLTTNICDDRDINTEEVRSYVQGYIFGEVLRKRRITVLKDK